MAKRKRFDLRPGDKVLMGRPGYVKPADWYTATQLWSDQDGVLIAYGAGGELQKIVEPAENVRAVGHYAALFVFRDKAAATVAAIADRVKAAEHELSAARAAVWATLDQVCASPRRLEGSQPPRDGRA